MLHEHVNVGLVLEAMIEEHDRVVQQLILADDSSIFRCLGIIEKYLDFNFVLDSLLQVLLLDLVFVYHL